MTTRDLDELEPARVEPGPSRLDPMRHEVPGPYDDDGFQHIGTVSLLSPEPACGCGTDWAADVRALFHAFEQPIPSVVGWPDEATMKLRRKMVVEEYGETIDAITARDFPEFVDGCVDLIVVTLGALVACGVDPGPVWRAVQQANLTKAGGPISADGKRMKPPGFVPPDVAALLREQGWRAPGESGR